MILKCVIILTLINQIFSYRNAKNFFNQSLFVTKNLFAINEDSNNAKIDWSQTLNLPVSSWDFHNFESIEKKAQRKWDSDGSYLQSIANNLKYLSNNDFEKNTRSDHVKVICDGPPYANGHFHMGHLLNRTIKDIILRYWLSQGHVAIIIPGWDCHGLPIEHKAKKVLGSSTLLEKCKSLSLASIKSQALSTGRLGCWALWGLCYGTILPLYKEIVKSTFNHLLDNNIIRKGPLPVLYSVSAGCVVADAEIELKDVIRTCSYVPYQINQAEKIDCLKGIEFDKLFIVAYTTEPWTLFANQGLAISSEITYNVYKNGNNLYIFNGMNPYGEWVQISEIKGSDLVGLKYTNSLSSKENIIIDGDKYINPGLGTGIVHLSGAHSHSDFQILVNAGVDTFRNLINESGRLIDYPTISAYSVELDDLLRSKIDILHLQSVVRKPFCRRTGGNIFTRIMNQYWLNTGQLKSNVLGAINKIDVMPIAAKNYLYKAVLNRPNYWCLSRQRPWGCIIDINRDKSGSAMELTNSHDDTTKIIKDLPRECLDVWFESGLNWMYNHMAVDYLMNDFFPNILSKSFKNNANIVKMPDEDFKIGENEFFTDFNKYVQTNIKMPLLKTQNLSSKYLMIEGQDQHRGWFQSSLFTLNALDVDDMIGKIVTHGFVINEGEIKKVSKSLLDHGQADKFLSLYGADTLRLFIASSDFHQKDIYLSKLSLERAKDLKFRLCNTFKFILGIKKYTKGLKDFTSIGDNNLIAPKYPLDENILLQLQDFQLFAKENYESFNYSGIINKLKVFLKYLSSNYVTIIKDIIYTESIESPRAKSAFETLCFIGQILSRIVAPIVPHLTQEFNDLMGNNTNLHSRWSEFKISKKYVNEIELAFQLRELVIIQLNRAVDTENLRYFGQARVNIAANSKIKNLIEAWNGSTGDDLRLFFGVASVDFIQDNSEDIKISIEKVSWNKCDRCWLYRESVIERSIKGINHILCDRCNEIGMNL